MSSQNPFLAAMKNVDKAVDLSRRRDSANRLPEGYARNRYEVLRRNPELLVQFVSEALETDDPSTIMQGARQYLEEMEQRYESD